MMNTTENNQKVYIEGYNHGEIFEAGVHGIGPLQGTDELQGKVYVNYNGTDTKFLVIYRPSKDVWEFMSPKSEFHSGM